MEDNLSTHSFQSIEKPLSDETVRTVYQRVKSYTQGHYHNELGKQLEGLEKTLRTALNKEEPERLELLYQAKTYVEHIVDIYFTGVPPENFNKYIRQPIETIIHNITTPIQN